jgi:hypothetical protein
MLIHTLATTVVFLARMIELERSGCDLNRLPDQSHQHAALPDGESLFTVDMYAELSFKTPLQYRRVLVESFFPWGTKVFIRNHYFS